MTNWFEGRLARITAEGIQYDLPTTDTEIKMTDNSGRAFVNGETAPRVMDVTDWTTLLSLPPALAPVASLANGRFAMHDSSAATLTEFAADGTPIQSGSVGGGPQTRFRCF